MLKKNDIIEIMIDDISVEGAGIGRFEGQIVFVQKALPEEYVQVKIIKATKSYAVGLLIEILSESKHRTESFCPVFGKCGGCTLQHLEYDAQLSYKANYIKQCIKRIGGIDIEMPQIIAAQEKKAYRNKASFPVTQIDGKAAAGFYAPYSHRVVPSYCSIQQPQVNEVKDIVIAWANETSVPAYDETTGKGKIRHIVARRSSNGEIMAGLVSTEPIIDDKLISALKEIPGMKSIVANFNAKKTNAILGYSSKVVFGDEYIIEKYDDLSFRVRFADFLQINHEQSEKLYKTALEFADISKNDIVYDLFCGIGTISLLAAKNAKSIVGIEYMQTAVNSAEENAILNGITNASFIAGDAGEKLSEAVALAGKPDIVILDPPRKGCEQSLIESVCNAEPEKIVYVSCSPATLARDIAVFSENGYTLSRIKGVDMFPQTTHVETVCLLTRK